MYVPASSARLEGALLHRPLAGMNGDGSSHQAIQGRRGLVLQGLEARCEQHPPRSVQGDGHTPSPSTGGHSRGMATAGPALAFTSVMTPAATTALMMWWRQ